MKKYLLLLFCPFLLNSLAAQVRGTVSDKSGTPLPFASVYVKGTTQGTTTNLEGNYSIDLGPGTHQLVFQFIGYSQQIKEVNVQGKPVALNVVLEEETISLGEIEIKANAEDPAYPIIRKAIAKREYYKKQVPSFTCDVYIKGNVKILDAPEKLLGQDVDDMDGSLDTNRQGIVYLSESVSKLHFMQPDRFKEVMISSKVSGTDNGFSFNSAREMNFDLYENSVSYGRNVVSPIAQNALNFYKYRLEGAMVDENGLLIHKIAVLPKRSEDPAYQGFVYIVNDLWNLHGTDLFLTGNRVLMPLFDTLQIRQTFVPVEKPDVWRLFSQTFSMRGGAFGFKFGGVFTGIYTDYNLRPGLTEQFFGNELMKVEAGANEKDSTYWAVARPVPLTLEEAGDYHKKDSIKVVRESKTYLDSLDRKNNKLKVAALLFGYTYSNSWKRQAWSVKSPINTYQFSTVQGSNINLDAEYRKSFDKTGDRRLTVGGKLNYGFADERLRAAGRLEYNFDPKSFSQLQVAGGHEIAQYNEGEPISLLLNTSYSLFSKKHFARLYDKKFLRIEHRTEVANGVLVFSQIQYADRSPLENRTDFSLFKKDREYAPNIPINEEIGEGELSASRALTGGVSIRLRPAQKYYDYPDRKYIFGSKFPDLWLHYRGGFPVKSGSLASASFGRISAVLQKRNMDIGLVGRSSVRLEAGSFLHKKELFFQDYKHFMGNEITIGNPGQYLFSFKRLPYYSHSTKRQWLAGHWEHKFQGFLTDRLPLFKKLGWELVAGANFLYTTERKDYTEFSLGFDRIGFGILQLFRFDVVASFAKGKYDGVGYLLGVTLPIDDFQM